jgi:hypothetical protein
MKTLDAIQFFGSQESLKAALQLRTRKMPWGEHPPLARQYQIEVVTNGALRAERPLVNDQAEIVPRPYQNYLGVERRQMQRTAHQERPTA